MPFEMDVLDKLRKKEVWLPCIAICAFILCVTEAPLRNDFDIFLAAATSIFDGKDIYRATYFDGYHYYYSTFFAVLIYPLSLIPAVIAKSLWIILNLIFVVRMIQLSTYQFESLQISRRIQTLLVFLLVLLCFRFLKGNIHLGQMTIFILYLSLESLHQFKKSRTTLAAFLLALAINIKILPLVLIPYMIYRAQWKMTTKTLVFLIVLAFIPGLIIGNSYNMSLITSWWSLVNPAQTRHLMDVEETSFHGLTTVIPIFFMDQTGDRSSIDISRNIINLTQEQVMWAIHIVRLMIVLLALWFLRTLPFKKAKSFSHEWWELSYIFLCVPLIFPHQQHYAFLFMWPALGYLLAYTRLQFQSGKRTGIHIIALMIIFMCINAALIFGMWRNYFEHFKIVTLGALICVALLAFSNPLKMRIESKESIS